jgi:hypothetical protein
VKRYEYVRIFGYQESIQVCCTDNDTLDWITDAIKKGRPMCKVSFDEDSGCMFYRESRPVGRVVWWLFRELCHRGWMPLKYTNQWVALSPYSAILRPEVDEG